MNKFIFCLILLINCISCVRLNLEQLVQQQKQEYMVEQLKKLDASLDMNIDPTLDMQLNDYYNDVIQRYQNPPSNITDKVFANMVMPEELDPEVHLTQQQQQFAQVPSDLTKLKQAYENEIQKQMNQAVTEVYVNKTVQLALDKQKAELIKQEEQEQEELFKEKEDKKKLEQQLKEEQEQQKKLQMELMKSKETIDAQKLKEQEDEDKKKKKKHNHHHHDENKTMNETSQAVPEKQAESSLFSAIKAPSNSLFQSVQKTEASSNLFQTIKSDETKVSEKSLISKIKSKTTSPQELAELFKKQEAEKKTSEIKQKSQEKSQDKSLFDKLKSKEHIDFKEVKVQPVIQEQSLFEKIKQPKQKNEEFQNMKFTEKDEIINQNNATTQLPPNINVILSDEEKQMKAYEDEQNEILQEQDKEAKELDKYAVQKNNTQKIEEMRLKQMNNFNNTDLPKFSQVNKNMYDDIDKHIADQKEQNISEDSFLTKKEEIQEIKFKQQSTDKISIDEINKKFMEQQKKIQFARQQEKSKFSEKDLNQLEANLLMQPETPTKPEETKNNSLFGKHNSAKPLQQEQQKEQLSDASKTISDAIQKTSDSSQQTPDASQKTSDTQILNKKLDQVIDMFQQFLAMQMKSQIGLNQAQPQAQQEQSQQIEQPKFNQIDLKNNLQNDLQNKDSDFDQRLNQLKESIEGNQQTYETLSENIEESEPRFIQSKVDLAKKNRFKDFQEKQDDWSDEAALVPNFYVFNAQ